MAAEEISPPAEKPKSRVVAALLGLVAPGLGHAFIGHALRGVAWFAAPLALFTLYMAFAREPSTLTVFAVLAGLVLVGYVGAIADAALIPVRLHRPTSTAAVVAFAVAPILVAPMVAMCLRFFVVEAFKVPSGAMIPTIAVGDHLFVDKSVYRARAPRRGEVFVFKYPEHPEQDFVKRAIAIGGDKLEARGGHPIINGWEVPSCRVGTHHYVESYDGSAHEGELFVEFLEAEAYLVLFDTSAPLADYQGPYYAKPGETWVMGDNRNNSHDSRMWFGGQGGGVPARAREGTRAAHLAQSGRVASGRRSRRCARCARPRARRAARRMPRESSARRQDDAACTHPQLTIFACRRTSRAPADDGLCVRSGESISARKRSSTETFSSEQSRGESIRSAARVRKVRGRRDRALHA